MSAGRGSSIEGEAWRVSIREERGTSLADHHAPVYIWSFQIERFDPDGDRLTPVSVEVRARSLEGTLSDGDKVRVVGRLVPGRILKTKRFVNVTTGATIGATRRMDLHVPLVLGGGLAVIAAIATATWFGHGLLSTHPPTASITRISTGDATLRVSPRSGTVGERLTVSGRGFAADESVRVTFQAELLGTYLTDKNGRFQEAVRVPSDLAGLSARVEIDAVGAESFRSASVPFDLTS